MTLSDYTDPDTIRAILGVAEEELEDITIALPIYGIRLAEALTDLNANLADDYLTIKLIDPQTTVQKRFVDLVQAYASYTVAGALLGSIKMFAPKTIKDDKSEQTRVLDPYADLKEEVPRTLAYLQTRLLAAYVIVVPGTVLVPITARTRVVASGLGIDPVTGA